MYDQFFEVAKNLVLQAGEIALNLQNQLKEIKEKNPKDLVTEADLACDELIRAGLQQAFPNHGIMTEEGEDINPDSEFKWHVDPIDGTVNYAHGIPLWGVSVALEHKGQAQLGLVFCPSLNELYWGIAGQGAFCNGSQIRVNNNDQLSESLVIINGVNIGSTLEKQKAHNQLWFKIMHTVVPQVARIRSFGAAVVEALAVATGSASASFQIVYNAWDVAAVDIIVREAGGKTTNLQGGPFELNNGKAGAIFSNGLIHDSIVKLTIE